MRKFRVILSMALCLFSAIACFSQTARDVMDANQKVYELVESYIANADLTDRYAQKSGSFRNLFASQEATVYMDHIDWFNNANRKDTTDLASYCDFYSRQQGTFTQFGISDVRIDYQGVSDGEMDYTVGLTKKYTIPGDDQPVVSPLVLHVVYNPASKVAKITRIECSRPDSRMRPHISANYKRYDNAPYIPKTLKVNNIDGSYIHLDEQIRPLSVEVYSRLSGKNCATYSYDFEAQTEPVQHHTISVSTVKNAVGFEVGYAQSLGEPEYSVPADYSGHFNAPGYSERVFHIGAVYQRQLFARNRHRISLETGVAFDIDWQRLTVGNYKESREAVDPDGDAYTRLTTLADFLERSRGLDVAVPVMVRYDGYVTPSVSLFAAVGIRGGAFLSGVSTAFFDAFYAGQYGPEYFNVLIDQNHYYDFGRFDVNGIHDEKPASPRWHLDALARVGAQFFFTADKRWSAELSVGGRYGLLDKSQESLTQTASPCVSPDKDTFNSALRSLTARPPLFIECQAKLLYNF